MSIAEFSIKKKVFILSVVVVLLFAGVQSFNSMPRLEDPEFTIKDANVATGYPGATAEEVENEVSEYIERGVQELGQLRYVRSRSSRNLSFVKVTIKDQYDKNSLPQVWDELRRKVNDNQGKLPPGAGPSIVNDDFGDVYGVYVALTGEGYSYKELKDTAEFLQKDLLNAQDVKKIVLYGVRPEAIYIEMKRDKMANLGITQQDIYAALSSKNLVVPAGMVEHGSEQIYVDPTGEFTSEKQFGELLVISGETGAMVKLKDVAEVKREYQEPPSTLLRFDGKDAIGIGISTIAGGNVVKMGESLIERFNDLVLERLPVGMDIHPISVQSTAVTESINGFVSNLIQSVLIVIAVLFFAMGRRTGLIIGGVLIVTIMGSFPFIKAWGVVLERISLGALIISLGMLVDNAIVVTEGMQVGIEAGDDSIKTAKKIVGQTALPLLGATFIAILSFAAIGLSPDATGEFCRSLFQVILITLMMSWVTAVTVTPLFCHMFLKRPDKNKKADEKKKDPYGGKMFKLYKNGLIVCMKNKWKTLAIVLIVFFVAIKGFGYVDNSFFPDSTRSQFFIDFFFPGGTSLNHVSEKMKEVDAYLLEQDHVEHVATTMGGGEMRFLLTYTPNEPSSSFATTLINVDSGENIDGMIGKVQSGLEELLPGVVVNTRMIRIGPGEGGRIQLRISGTEGDELRVLAGKAKKIIEDTGDAQGVRDDWKEKVKVIRPQIADAQAERQGILRTDVAKTTESFFPGVQTGLYREGDNLIPIVARSPAEERTEGDNLSDIQIWSPAAKRMIPMSQVVPGTETKFEDENIWRRHRVKTIIIHADAKHGVLPSALFAEVKAKIEKALGVDIEKVTGKNIPDNKWTDSTIKVEFDKQLPLKGKPGYYMAWGGEAENSASAQKSLSAPLPMFFVMMLLITIFLFNSIRKPLIIWCTVPMAIIGVTIGLLITRQPFGFMAVLGFLSLAGMIVKNVIVLLDQVNAELKDGKEPFSAIVDASVSRMRPVAMASLTTMMGMLTLFKDAFFVSMAVTIVFGLGFATVLTLVVVPVLYSIFFKVKEPA